MLTTPSPFVFHPIVYSGAQVHYISIYNLLPFGSISNDLDDDDRSKPGRCKSVPSGSCAVLYDDESCEGWSHKIPYESYPAYDLPKDNRNDAEVVVVRSGCKFTGMIIDLQCTSDLLPLHPELFSSPSWFPLGFQNGTDFWPGCAYIQIPWFLQVMTAFRGREGLSPAMGSRMASATHTATSQTTISVMQLNQWNATARINNKFCAP